MKTNSAIVHNLEPVPLPKIHALLDLPGGRHTNIL
jgi:hypothetical protein